MSESGESVDSFILVLALPALLLVASLFALAAHLVVDPYNDNSDIKGRKLAAFFLSMLAINIVLAAVMFA